MDKFLLYDERQQLIETDEMFQFFSKCPHVSAIRSSPDVIATIEGDYVSACGFVTIRLISSCYMIVIEGTSEVALEAILAIKTVLGRPLHVIDENYSFDIPLAHIQTVVDLDVAIKMETGTGLL